MRYICEPDIAREKSGWGKWSWVIDTTQTEFLKRKLMLLPEVEAEAEAARLNDQIGKLH